MTPSPEAPSLTIHHLGLSQSERIVWLCEELAIPYALRHYVRDPATRLSPPELRALHPLGAAPVVDDGPLRLAESGAIVEYLLARYGGDPLRRAAGHPDYGPYLYWLHFANGTLQPTVFRRMLARRAELPSSHPLRASVDERLDRVLRHVDARLDEHDYLAGRDLTAADVMNVFSLTTMRVFEPFDLAPYAAIRAYLARIGARPAYRRAMAKSDPGFTPLTD